MVSESQVHQKGRSDPRTIDAEHLNSENIVLMTSARSSNSLSQKVASVLSTSFSDAEFREALSLLDQRCLTNDAKARRQIRLDLQRDVIICNGIVINSFGCVSEQLRSVKFILDKVNTEYEDMKSQVALAQVETALALHETTSLLDKRELLSMKQSVLSIFQDRFIMTDVEIASLTSTAEPVDERFFSALYKAKKISKDCEILLGLENQAFGLDLMEQTSKHLNFGFQKLYKGIQREFKTLNLENPQMSASIRRSLRVLAERPSLFQSCLDFFSEARERILSEAFHIALTGTAPSGTNDHSVKPIDLAAHDILRYVGDMLAWVHSAAVSEREALEVLFVAEGEELAKSLKSGPEIWQHLPHNDGSESEFNTVSTLGDLVDKDMSGTARLLRQRVEQVIQVNEEIIPAYKVATLLGFYLTTFEKMIGSASNLVECIRSSKAEALRQFRSLIKDNIAVIHGDSQKVSVDLVPPTFLIEALNQLTAIMQTYDSSLSSYENRESEFEGVMSDAFEPFLSGCDNMARLMTPLKRSIFTVNFSLVAEKCLAQSSFTERRAEQLRQNIKHEAAKIVESQYEFFRVESGLDPAIFSRDNGLTKIRSYVDQDILVRASQHLDEFLPSALTDAIDRIRYLQDAVLARQITAEAAELFCRDFENLELEVDRQDSDTVGGNGSLRSVFPRTSAEIRVLLS
ncbi:Golgi transport complex subunit 6 [Conoideocrella luteorostrata]|uniref:Conserved oligomeric Golgi complex subunit 6 n=1 Tax=Conoideocrella luteorostrata TaxID=1105319 RepID=A0AAJ0G385_9HYPO|nr:Golgi transport complex subunit 6 [Conoideocrella luteorostrata]